jgi:hypothetical protein
VFLEIIATVAGIVIDIIAVPENTESPSVRGWVAVLVSNVTVVREVQLLKAFDEIVVTVA